MNLTLDATYSSGSDLSGVGVYSRELLLGLARAHPEQRFTWRYRPHRYWKERGALAPGNVSRGLLLESVGARAGLFHGLNQRLPRRRFRRQVATFHDLFVMTAEYSSREFRARFTAQAKHAAEQADRIIAVSRFTASQVEGLLGVERSRIRVVHHGVRALPLAEENRREKMVLSVGAIQRRKNTARLVDAFAALPSEWRLVLAGSYGYGAEDALARIASSPARERIQVTGYVSDPELTDLYARASIFAFPSLDEGFGMPVLEAMSRGLPVIAARRSSLPEVAGDAAILIDPEDTDELSMALLTLVRDPSETERLRKLGFERAKEFTWKKAVAATWGVYGELSV